MPDATMTPVGAWSTVLVSRSGTERSASRQCRPNNVATYLLSSDRVLVDAPALTETIGQLKDGQDQFSFGRPALLEAGLQSQALDIGGILGSSRKVEDCLFGNRLAAPSVPGTVSMASARGQIPRARCGCDMGWARPPETPFTRYDELLTSTRDRTAPGSGGCLPRSDRPRCQTAWCSPSALPPRAGVWLLGCRRRWRAN